MSRKILTKNFDTPNSERLETYLAGGGYRSLPKALGMKPENVVEEVKTSNIRGRGGAGFPAGMKWNFLPKGSDKPVYLCINADEGEPGTFKDREIMEKDPHMLIEGIIITCWAIKCHGAYVYIRGEFVRPAKILQQAIDEAYAKGYLGKNILGAGFDLDVTIHRGAGAYICGEETALIESIEGKKGQPRLKPPFPASVGLFNSPTIVNNVETIASVPWIIANGGSAYAAIGSPKSTGTKLFSVCGHVNKPGVYEIEMGYPLMNLINNECGGMLNGMKLKAAIPGGSSCPVLKAEEAKVAKLDYESLQEVGTMLGSGGTIVMGEGTDMVHALRTLMNFYSHESCGQCTPCREGTGWLRKIVTRIDEGKGRPEDIELIEDIANSMMGTTVCPLSDAAAMPAISFVQKFRAEFEEKINKATETN